MRRIIAVLALAATGALLSAGYLTGSGTTEVIDPREEMTITCGTVPDGGGIPYVSATACAAGKLCAGQTYRFRADPNSDGVKIGFNKGFTSGLALSTSPEAFALGARSGSVGIVPPADGGVSEIVCASASGTASVSIHPVRAGEGQ